MGANTKATGGEPCGLQCPIQEYLGRGVGETPSEYPPISPLSTPYLFGFFPGTASGRQMAVGSHRTASHRSIILDHCGAARRIDWP